jgi:DNA-binding NarL/FixJ family response regulator
MQNPTRDTSEHERAMARPTRVLIADDEALVRAGFRQIINADPELEVVAEAADGAEAVEAVSRSSPDIAVLDVTMPRLDGIAATRRIVEGDGGRPRVLVLTSYGNDEYVYEALLAGASGILLKDARPEQLVGAIKVIAAGEALLDPGVTRSVIEEFARRAPPSPQAASEPLTEREREVLELIGRGNSNAEIAEALGVTLATVKTHVTHILMKLGVRDRAQAIVYAYDSGLVKPGQAPRP